MPRPDPSDRGRCENLADTTRVTFRSATPPRRTKIHGVRDLRSVMSGKSRQCGAQIGHNAEGCEPVRLAAVAARSTVPQALRPSPWHRLPPRQGHQGTTANREEEGSSDPSRFALI
jgi:hypothetical protein